MCGRNFAYEGDEFDDPEDFDPSGDYLDYGCDEEICCRPHRRCVRDGVDECDDGEFLEDEGDYAEYDE